VPSPTPSASTSLLGLARRLLARLVRHPPRETYVLVWARMRPIDFDGEDTSLREDELRCLR